MKSSPIHFIRARKFKFLYRILITAMNNNNRFGILYSAVHFIASICILIQLIDVCNGHGRLLEPPGRSSAWRFGFKVPINYNDDELFCGGLFHQIGLDGKCGVCGDAWDAPEPRPNEYGGTYGLGVVVRKYQPGAEIPIGIQLTTSHMGYNVQQILANFQLAFQYNGLHFIYRYFEFRVCPKLRPTQECLDQNLLEVISGSPSSSQPNDLHTRFYPRHGSVKYDIVARLPEGKEIS